MDVKHVRTVLAITTQKIAGKPVLGLINEIARESRDLKGISLENQYALGAALGSMLHKAYCDGRKLPTPNENGLPNNPRLKELNDTLDAEYVRAVLNGEIKTGPTLFVQDGKVYMDIANRDFSQLSPYWQYDNFMAGCCAARSVITNWEGLTNNNEVVRHFTTIAVANGIHEAWIARGNVGDWNAGLATAYINLPEDEKDKDLEHYRMATRLIDYLQKELNSEQTSESETTSAATQSDVSTASNPIIDSDDDDLPV